MHPRGLHSPKELVGEMTNTNKYSMARENETETSARASETGTAGYGK